MHLSSHFHPSLLESRVLGPIPVMGPKSLRRSASWLTHPYPRGPSPHGDAQDLGGCLSIDGDMYEVHLVPLCPSNGDFRMTMYSGTLRKATTLASAPSSDS